MKIYLYNIVIAFFSLFTFGQEPNIQMQKCFGGTLYESLNNIKKTNDGGYILVGSSISTDGDVTFNYGKNDYWIVKLDSSFDIVWQKSFGGSSDDTALSIFQTNDGGYVVFGVTRSNDGHITINHGASDYWIIKIDASGNLIWQRSYGDYSTELFTKAKAIIETSDGGIIFCGSTFLDQYRWYDCWVVKLNSIGDIIWQKKYGGSYIEIAQNIKQTTDGGYVIAASTQSNNGDITFNHGLSDCWILKLDSLGNLIWQKSYGGSNHDSADDIIQSSDGGYIFVGSTSSNDGNVTFNNGGSDIWIVKLDSSGNLLWEKSYGGSMTEYPNSIIQTEDGNYLISGYSNSNNGNLTNKIGLNDYWFIKINPSGSIIWQKALGGSNEDLSRDAIQTLDNSFVIVGSTLSNDGNVSGNHGEYDGWLVKLFPENLNTYEFDKNEDFIFPNPSNNFISIRSNNIVENFNYKIIDIIGRIVQNGNSKFNEQINIENLENGNYIIKIQTDNKEILSQKLIKN